MKDNNSEFYNNIALLISKKDFILSDSNLYMTPVVLYPFGVLGMKFSNMPIGAWLELWDTYPDLFDVCTCGGKAAVVSFGGSVFSGRHQRSSVCLNCGKIMCRSNGSLSTYSEPFAEVLIKYKALTPCNTITLSELIAVICRL
jgi:hypothetical protein